MLELLLFLPLGTILGVGILEAALVTLDRAEAREVARSAAEANLYKLARSSDFNNDSYEAALDRLVRDTNEDAGRRIAETNSSAILGHETGEPWFNVQSAILFVSSVGETGELADNMGVYRFKNRLPTQSGLRPRWAEVRYTLWNDPHSGALSSSGSGKSFSLKREVPEFPVKSVYEHAAAQFSTEDFAARGGFGKPLATRSWPWKVMQSNEMELSYEIEGLYLYTEITAVPRSSIAPEFFRKLFGRLYGIQEYAIVPLRAAFAPTDLLRGDEFRP